MVIKRRVWRLSAFFAPTAHELQTARANPSIQRALLAYELGLNNEATREWNYATNLHLQGDMNDRDLLAAAEEEAIKRRFAAISCGQVMSSQLLTVSPQTSLEIVADLFHRHLVKSLPVVDGLGHLVGRVVRPDLFDWLWEGHRQSVWRRMMRLPGRQPRLAQSLMREPEMCVQESTPLGDLLHELASHQVQFIAVLRDHLTLPLGLKLRVARYCAIDDVFDAAAGGDKDKKQNHGQQGEAQYEHAADKAAVHEKGGNIQRAAAGKRSVEAHQGAPFCGCAKKRNLCADYRAVAKKWQDISCKRRKNAANYGKYHAMARGLLSFSHSLRDSRCGPVWEQPKRV